MRICRCNANVSFGRALTPAEKQEYSKVLTEARKVANDGGKSILIVHEPCLPQAASTDIGVGHLTSKSSSEFFDFAKNTLGINTIEVLPPGEMRFNHARGFYNTYNASALSLGTQQIDLELLTKPQFHSILSADEFQKVVDANAATQKVGFANFENVVGESSPQEKALRAAFEKYMTDSSIDKKPFEAYKSANADWLDSKAIYPVLKKEHGGKHWSEWTDEVDKNLIGRVDNDAVKRMAELKIKHGDEIEFYKFKQFLADEHLKLGKKQLNSKGMKLIGDCLIGFSEDETWAYQKAFKKGVFVGLPEWGLPALNYENILDNNSASQKLLRKKVELFAKRYDGIRFDCSWAYVKPRLSDKNPVDLGEDLLKIIEGEVKKVKGKNFDMSCLIHEFEADPKDFSIFNDEGRVLPFLKNRVKVVSSTYMGDKYGTTKAMKAAGAGLDDFVIGVGNHDPQPLRQIADNIPENLGGGLKYRRDAQSAVLRDIFKLPRKDVASPSDFSKLKFAEPLMAKNQMVFYMDALGRSERFDSQAKNGWKNYRYRIGMDYAEQYQKTAQSGYGYLPMDAYSKVYKAKGLDATHKDLYEKIVKFRDIVAEKTVDAIGSAKKKIFDLSGSKLFNIGAVVAALGLIGVVVSSANKGLQEQYMNKADTLNK